MASSQRWRTFPGEDKFDYLSFRTFCISPLGGIVFKVASSQYGIDSDIFDSWKHWHDHHNETACLYWGESYYIPPSRLVILLIILIHVQLSICPKSLRLRLMKRGQDSRASSQIGWTYFPQIPNWAKSANAPSPASSVGDFAHATPNPSR